MAKAEIKDELITSYVIDLPHGEDIKIHREYCLVPSLVHAWVT